MKHIPQFRKTNHQEQSEIMDSESKNFHEMVGNVRSRLADLEAQMLDAQIEINKLLDLMDDENDIGNTEEPLNETSPTPSFTEVHEESVASSKGDDYHPENTVLQLIKEYMERRIGWQAATWLDSLELMEFTDQEIILCTDSEFRQHIIKSRLGDYIKDAITELFGYDAAIIIILHRDGTR